MNAIQTVSEALKYIQSYRYAQFCKRQKSEPKKLSQIAIFSLYICQKMISRKIRLVGKFIEFPHCLKHSAVIHDFFCNDFPDKDINVKSNQIGIDLSTFQSMTKSGPNQMSITMDGYMITGVPLEDCPMCPDLECVPLLVRTCCKMVEEKGLDIVGIYRVPGNSAAVNALTEQVLQDIRNQCCQLVFFFFC